MADVAATLSQWSTTASSNAPADSTAIGSGLGDNLRTLQAVVATYLAAYNGSAIASAGTCAIGGVAGLFVEISGTNAITAFGTPGTGSPWKIVKFQDALTLTHNGTSLVLPGAANITTAAGDYCLAFHRGSGNWTVPFYQRASGAPPKEDWTIFNAKGDLIIASAADTAARHAVGNNGTLLQADSAQSDGWVNWVPRNYISGLIVSSGADISHDVTVAVGEATDDTHAYMLKLASALTKRGDEEWAEGTNVGGMAAGEALSIAAQINIWLIGKTDGTTDVLMNDHATSGLTPTLPAGYTLKRLIGARMTSLLSAHLVEVSAFETPGGGELVLIYAPIVDVYLDDTLTNVAQRTDRISVPALTGVIANVRAKISDSASGCLALLTNTFELDVPPDGDLFLPNIRSTTSFSGYQELRIPLAGDGLIAARSNIATADKYTVQTLGWEWSRRL